MKLTPLWPSSAWTSAKRWPARAWKSTSPSTLVPPSPSLLTPGIRCPWPWTARRKRRPAHPPSEGMPDADETSWKRNVVLQLWLPFLLPQPTIQSLPPTPPGIVIPQPTIKIRSMLSSLLELAGNHFSLRSPRRWRFHLTMSPVHLFVQLVEVVVTGSFQELTPSVRGTISMFATVVVDIPSLSHHLM